MAEQKFQKFFSIQTLGCKVNQYESDLIAWELKKKGWCIATPQNKPGLCIINTCTVTGKASMQARQMIRKAIRQYPEACIVVTGCYAQTEPEEIEKITGVHYIFGQSDKPLLSDKIDAAAGNPFQPKPPKPVTFIKDIGNIRTFDFNDIPVDRNRTRPVVKIQDGCNAFCTYCIVPYTRGRSRSLSLDRVINQINRLHQAGFLEIVLTGTHLGNFGRDLDPKTDFETLLGRILTLTSIPRIRLSSIESNEISENMILMVKDSDRFCDHFHLPLQSGDNTLLKKMNRPYTRKDFENQVLRIHKHIPDCGMGADVLVGFPGETDAAFKNTIDLIQNLPLTYLHVFPFSPRKKTPAATFPDQVPLPVIKERCRVLRKIGDHKKQSFYQSLTGKKASVLLEEKSHYKNGLIKGLSSNYVPIHVAENRGLENTIVTVTVKEVIPHFFQTTQITCRGEI